MTFIILFLSFIFKLKLIALIESKITSREKKIFRLNFEKLSGLVLNISPYVSAYINFDVL